MTWRPPPPKPAMVLFGASAVLVAAIAACVSEDPGPLPSSTTDAGDTCSAYCDDVLRTCTGEDRAFDNREQCMKMCALIPPGQAGDKANSIACRQPSASAGSQKQTCAVAGAYGGNVCGPRCDTFCELVLKQCIEPFQGQPPAPFPNKADCTEACAAMRYDPDDGEGTGATDFVDTLNCRMRHLILSLDGRETHCPHVAKISDLCKDNATNVDIDGGHDGGHDGGGGNIMDAGPGG